MGKQTTRRRTVSRAWAETLEARRLLSVSLLKDIATTQVTQPVVQFGGSAYFVAFDQAHGYELWKTDGTAAGTAIVRDINPGPASSGVSELTVANGKLYFAASDGTHGSELWTTDGTAAGTTMVADICAGTDGSSPARITAFNGKVYFAAADAAHGREIWSSDGTAAGTALAAETVSGSTGSAFSSIIAAGSKLYFATRTASGVNRAVWATDGTQAGTIRLTTAPINVDDLTAVGTTVYFQGINMQLWKTNGTVAGTGLVVDPTPGSISWMASKTVVGGILYFHTYSSSSGDELWRSDGTAGGTYVVKDVNPGAGSALAGSPAFAAVNGTLYFVADDGVHGNELWKSDGTAAGTVLVKDIYPGSGGSWLTGLTNVNGTLYFQANDGTYGAELWKTDGTAAGTVRVSDAAAGSKSASPYGMTAVGSSVVFIGATAAGTGAVFKTDGTLAGTAKVCDVQLPNEGSDVHDLAVMDGQVYFIASPGGNREQLWKSDGTPAGTTPVADVNPWYRESWTYLTTMGGKLYFAGADNSGREELWVSDGTPGGTHVLNDVRTGSWYYGPEMLTVVGNTLYFVATDGANGHELWKSDGTAAGTVMVKDVRPGMGDSNISNLTAVGDVLYFTADDGEHGVELWRSGGTAADTFMVSDIQAGTASSSPSLLTANGSTLYFFANDGSHGAELWKSDSGGTSLVKDIFPGASGSIYAYTSEMVALGGAVYFSASNGLAGAELWRSDGTPAGTAMVMDIRPGSSDSSVRSLTPFNGKLAFAAYAPGGLGDTIWLTDGTAAGTVPAYPGGTAPGPYIGAYGMGVVGDYLYYWADDGGTRYGRELWRTDGTEAGTRMVKDVNPGPSDAHYGGFNYVVIAGGQAFFVADDGETGYELWVAAPPAPSITPASVQEDGAVSLSAAVGPSANAGEPLTYVWDLDQDGIFGETGSAATRGDEVGAQPTFSATGLAAGAYPVAVRVTDGNGLVGTATGAVTVNNAAPAVALSPLVGPWTEGTSVHASATASDTPTDAAAGLQITWAVTRDGAPYAAGGGTSIDFVAADQGTYVITVTATDQDGASATASATLAVASAPPTGTVSVTGPAVEGSAETVTVSGVADPSTADTSAGFTYSVDVGNDGTFEVTDTPAPQWSFVPPDNGTYPVRVRIKDKDGAYTDYVTTVVVANVAPTATFSDGTAAAGIATTLTMTNPADPSSADVAAGLTFSFDLDNDGTFETPVSTSPSVTAVFATTGPHVVRARVRDKDGATSDYTATINVVMPPAPTAVFSAGTATVDEGSAGSVSFAVPAGAGPFTYSYDFDNDGTFEVASAASASVVVPAAYLADGPFTRTVRGRVTDRFGQSTDYTAGILVLNVAPTLAIPAAAGGSVVLGTRYTLSLGSFDPGRDGVTSWRVAWDDGTTSDLHAATGVVGHDYAAAGVYHVVITATDDDGSYTETRSVAVTAAPPAAAFAAGALAGDGSAYTFTVTYTDDLGIDTATLGDGDFRVTGPAGTSLARLVSFAAGAGNSVVATYAAPSPLGTWSWQDSGAYSVSARAGEVKDLQGIALAAGEVGGFVVALSPAVLPDLVGAFAGPAPKSLTPGGKGTVSVKVTNRGAKSAPAATWTTRLYLSADGTIDPADVLVGASVQKGVALPINGSRSYTIAYAVPKGIAGGQYRLLMQVDATGTVAERDERNNVVAAPGLVSVVTPSADLSTSFATKPKLTYKPGESMALGLKVTNAGPSEANGTAAVRFFFSEDPVLDSGDRLVLTSALSLKLKGKASAVFNKTVKLPAGMPPGKWYVLAVTDGTSVGDRNTTNNVANAPFRI